MDGTGQCPLNPVFLFVCPFICLFKVTGLEVDLLILALSLAGGLSHLFPVACHSRSYPLFGGRKYAFLIPVSEASIIGMEFQ